MQHDLLLPLWGQCFCLRPREPMNELNRMSLLLMDMAKRRSERNSERKHENIFTHLGSPRDFAPSRMLMLPFSYVPG